MTLLTLLRTLSVGYFAQHRTRSLLVVLSIALGVATLVATQALNRSLKAGVQEGVNPVASLADLMVVRGQAGVPAALAKEIAAAKIPGVAESTPFVLYRMSLIDLGNRDVWLIGVERSAAGVGADNYSPGNALGITVKQTYDPAGVLEKLRLLSAPPAVVSRNVAEALKADGKGPRRFKMRNAGRTPELTVVGEVDFANSDLPLKNYGVVVVDLATASAICFPEAERAAEVPVHQIGVKVVAGADLKKVQADLQAYLGERADVQTIEAGKALVSDVTSGLEIGFAIGGAGALVVGLFLVYNALSVSVAERRHDIGILRSVGATRYQITGLFIAEAAAMGLVGSCLGLPIGWGLASLAVGPLSGIVGDLLVPIDSPRVILSPWLMLTAVASGIFVAVGAALVPAIGAAAEEPADAVRRVPKKNPVLFAVLQVGGMVTLLTLGLVLANYRRAVDPLFGPRTGMFAGVVLLLVGGLVATPLLASAVGRLLQPLFRYLFGLEGRLAADNLVRTPGRTGLVIAALAATGGLMVQTAGFLRSTREAIYGWVEEKIAADLFVTSGSAVTSGGSALSMREDMVQKLAALDGVEAVMPVRFHRIDYKSPADGETRIVFMVGLDVTGFAKGGGDRELARNMAKFPRLAEKGTVVVSENFSSLYGVKPGDRIKLPIRGKQRELEVVGTVLDYTWNRGTVMMDMARFREEFADRQVDVLDIFLKPGADAQVVRKVIEERYGDAEGLFVVDRKTVHTEVQSSLQRIYSMAYAQQTVVGLVALLGVVSSLFISVLQRRRELGLLRAVGATQAQILRSVLAEAILMGVVGAAVGFGIGLMLEWYVIDIVILDESGFRFPMKVAWFEAGIVVAASVTLATLAGLWPAYWATTLRIPEAIAYE